MLKHFLIQIKIIQLFSNINTISKANKYEKSLSLQKGFDSII
jgi:hypothetical protein